MFLYSRTVDKNCRSFRLYRNVSRLSTTGVYWFTQNRH